MEQIARAETMSDLAETPDPAVGDLDAVVLAEHAFRLELLAHVARLDTEERWRIDGALSMAAWLATRYSLADSSAREWVKVARAITEQPSVREAFAEGRLSWDQLRALIRLTNPDNEAEWATKAPGMSVAEIRAANRTVKRDEVVDAHRDRSVRWWFDEDLPRFHMTVEMPDAEGAALATWLTRRASQYDPDPETGRFELFETRCADALHEFASQALADDGDHDRATVVIRTDLATLLGDGG
ncbi:MAG: 13E12 repeat family protein, partial [Acidimicrobiia bacterium]|nr:13E12 repeat family protein [Acidimicrobiia bacterium]